MCAVYLAYAQQVVLLPSRHINHKDRTIINNKIIFIVYYCIDSGSLRLLVFVWESI